jgi:hypothetical protein
VTAKLFPPHLRSVDTALSYIPDWVETIGGQLTGNVVTTERENGALIRIGPAVVEFLVTSSHLRFAIEFDANLESEWYRFDLRRSDELLWRYDCHPGHEKTLGGLHHKHIGPGENNRVSTEPMTLRLIGLEVVETLLDLT